MVARIVATLTRVVLNTPPAVFDDIHRNIDKTPYFLMLAGKQDEALIKKRIRRAIKYRDLGMLFFLLTCCMPKAPDISIQFSSFIAATLARAGFKEDWAIKSEAYASQLFRTVENFELPYITQLASCGRSNFTKLINSGYRIDLTSMHLPSCYIERDTEILPIFNIEKNELAGQDIEKMYELGSKTELWIGKVVSACINF